MTYCYTADRPPRNYSAKSLVEELKEVQPFLNCHVKSYSVKPYVSITIATTVDHEMVETYTKAYDDRDISNLVDVTYCHYHHCYNKNGRDREGEGEGGDEHFCSLHVSVGSAEDIDTYNCNTLERIKVYLDKAQEQILLPDHIIYQDIELLSDHRILYCWKMLGESPKMMLERILREHSIPKWIKACYTDRLDPMASGLSIVLMGSGNVADVNRYKATTDDYVFQAILGISTDAQDPLGEITFIEQVTQQQAQKFARTIGTIRQAEVLSVVEITLSSHVNDCIGDILEVNRYYGTSAFSGNQRIKQWRQLPNAREAKDGLSLWKVVIKAKVSGNTSIKNMISNTAISLGIPAHSFRITRTGIWLDKQSPAGQMASPLQ